MTALSAHHGEVLGLGVGAWVGGAWRMGMGHGPASSMGDITHFSSTVKSVSQARPSLPELVTVLVYLF